MPAPVVRVLSSSRGSSAVEYRCRHQKGEPSFVEAHDAFTAAFVNQGSFGYTSAGRRHELVAGAVLLGVPGHEYSCTHDHAVGDVCLSFSFSRSLLEEIAGERFPAAWEAGAVPPAEKIMVVGALAAACADGASDRALDEIGLELAGRVIETVRGAPLTSWKAPAHVDRRRAVRAAELMRARYSEAIDLEMLATEVRLSSFHFLRMFSRVIGVTPHQYLLRTRLAAAARFLVEDDRPISSVALDSGFGDLSGFVRSFRRASGVSPRQFRRARFSKNARGLIA